MKKTIRKIIGCLMVLFLTSTWLFGQGTCTTDIQEKIMTTPRTSVFHSSSANLWQFSSTHGGMEIEDDRLSNEKGNLALAASIWVKGYRENGDLLLSAPTFGPSFNSNSGPLNADGSINEVWCIDFKQVWEANDADNDLLLADFADNGIIDDPVPASILSWPAKNNPYSMSANGFDLPEDRDLAPFVDQNLDGIYDPQQGDYPMIKNAEIAHWWMYNTVSDLMNLPLEFNCLAYSYDMDIEEGTKIFYEIEMTNRSDENFENMTIGIWMDGGIGCFNDDYAGCSPNDNLGYLYNGDDVDGDNCACPNNSKSFCEGLPLLGIKMLEGAKNNSGEDLGMTSFIAYNNPAIGGPRQQGTSDAQTALEYSNYLDGIWRDGLIITEGGNGYDPNSTEQTSFMYPNVPDDTDGWSMCSEGLPSSDIRMLMNTGTFDLMAGGKNGISFAALVTGPVNYPCPDIAALIDLANQAEDLYFDPPSSLQTPLIKTEIKVHPNPANEFVNITLDAGQLIEQIILTNSAGIVVRSIDKINQEKFQIPGADLSAGVYFLEVYAGDGFRGVEKIIFF